VMIGAAVLAAAQLRHLRPSSEPQPGSSMDVGANGRIDTTSTKK